MKTKLIAVQIPAKYKWRAIDANGAVYAYTHKPVYNNFNYIWDSKNGNGECITIGKVSPCKDRRNTLERIVEIEWSK